MPKKSFFSLVEEIFLYQFNCLFLAEVMCLAASKKSSKVDTHVVNLCKTLESGGIRLPDYALAFGGTDFMHP